MGQRVFHQQLDAGWVQLGPGRWKIVDKIYEYFFPAKKSKNE
jgi:hypothetical protein